MVRHSGSSEGSIWRRLESIKHDDPNLNERSWAKVQPCRNYRFFGRNIFITQPSSSFWVYFLGFQTTLVGCLFLLNHLQQVSRMLWGVSLVFWGVGAIVAGTSYQAFGFQLKCRGRDRAVWTSWWEVVYLLLQQYSVSVMLVAVAYACLSDLGQTVSIIVATSLSIAYTIAVMYGAFKPVKLLITFELMVHVCTPLIFFMLGLNLWRFYFGGGENLDLALENLDLALENLDLALIGVWLGLIATMMAYNCYMKSGYTESLWQRGTWFSENDVLHVVLILWVFYLALVLEPLLHDAV